MLTLTYFLTFIIIILSSKRGLGMTKIMPVLLLDKKKVKEKSTLKRCPNCQRPVPIISSTCPHCGYVFTRASVARSPIQEHDGELINVKSLKDFNSASQQDIIRAMARNARNLYQAIDIGKQFGLNSKSSWFIWKKILKKSY